MSNFVQNGQRMVFQDRERDEYRNKEYIECDLRVSTDLATNEIIGESLTISDFIVINPDQLELSIHNGMLKLSVPISTLIAKRSLELDESALSRSGLQDRSRSLSEQLHALIGEGNAPIASRSGPQMKFCISAKIMYEGKGLMDVSDSRQEFENPLVVSGGLPETNRRKF
jgi:hypothetical protein